ncbi:MAG TPA: zinc-binding dehydrogenase, partial [Acidimicrobiales bacterium]|nr:zinc-binding dehydrogenase [Acidimicrobiales bacterium]
IMAEKGRLVAFGTSAGPRGEVPLQALYRKGLTVNGYGGLIESDEALAAGIRAAMDALREGRMEVAVGRRVPLAEVGEAFRLLEERAVMGKIVLDLADHRTG